MDTNTTPVIDAATGWHCNADGVPLHRNTLISQLRAIGYTKSVSVSVPALRTMHAELLAAHAAADKPAKAKKVVTDADKLARSEKARAKAAERKAAKEAAPAEAPELVEASA